MDNKTHHPECNWSKSNCEYKETHYYCPHPEHACNCAEIKTALLGDTPSVIDNGILGVELPKYESHKTVRALKIKEIILDAQLAYKQGRETDGTAIIIPEEDYVPFRVSAEYVAKHNPKAGGYFIVYEDGYQSWSPASAFESGYTKIQAN